jgi:hypothetical protein
MEYLKKALLLKDVKQEREETSQKTEILLFF